jgi:hypothetical protein
MSRRKCCCKLDDGGDPPPKPDDSKCTEPQLYTTESINYGFEDNCKPRFHDGFGNRTSTGPEGNDTDYCWFSDKFDSFRDQNNNKIYDNYLGKHYTVLNTKDGLKFDAETPSFYGISQGGGLGIGDGKPMLNGIKSRHNFDIKSKNVLNIGFKIEGSCDLGFMRFGRTDIDQTGWGNRNAFDLGIPTYSYGPYPKSIGLEARFSQFKGISARSRDILFNNNGSLGLGFNDAFYETTLSIGEVQKVFNTPLAYYYNQTPTISWSLEIINIQYILVDDSILVPLGTIKASVNGGGDSLENTYDRIIGPCHRSNSQYTWNLLSNSIKLKNSNNTTAKNYYTTYPDALILTDSYPDIAFCFSAMDNFIWEPTIV